MLLELKPRSNQNLLLNYVPVAVTALGRLELAGEVIKPSVANAKDSRVNEMYVREGDRVEAGQLITWKMDVWLRIRL